MSGEAEERDAVRVRARNRTALIWIVAGCLVMATLGFLFALWMRGRPAS